MLIAHTVSSSLSRKCTLVASKGETVAPIEAEKKREVKDGRANGRGEVVKTMTL